MSVVGSFTLTYTLSGVEWCGLGGDVIFVSGRGAGRREDKYRLVITTALVKDPKTKKTHPFQNDVQRSELHM